jgi:hypothetical protein
MSDAGLAAGEIAVHATAESEVMSLPEHLVLLPSSNDWALWRWVALRGAGFAASLVHKLSRTDCAVAAGQVFQAEEAETQARLLALGVVNKTLDELRASSAWDDKATRVPLTKALRLLKAGKQLEPGKFMGDVRTVVEELRVGVETTTTATTNYQRAYEAAGLETSRAIRELLESDRLREAIIWQNRRAYRSGINSLLRTEITADSAPQGFKRRQNEQLVASYVQRYTVKNDTIGFFGPVGWARIVDSGGAIGVHVGADLLSKRTVYFESWCIDQIAELFSRNPLFKKWAAPRLLAYYYVHERTLYRSTQPPVLLSAEMAAVLSACDGNQTATAIASRLISNPELRLTGEKQVYDLFEQAADEGLIMWGFECQVGPGAATALRSQFDRIDDRALRTQALSVLEELENGRRAVSQAAGDPNALDRALEELEHKFSQLSGLAPTREAGATYAGRTLVYEDCQRDLEMNIGPELIHELDAPLHLLLMSARWFTFEAAKIVRRMFKVTYDELAAASGSIVVDGVAFWRKVHPALSDEEKTLLRPCVKELQRRWASVLELDFTQSRAAFRSGDLKARVEAAFAAPGPGWSMARYHSPDLMIAARSVEEIQRGCFQFVLGEIHLGFNTLTSVVFFEQHPAKHELVRATELDMPEPLVVPIPPRYVPGITTRTTQTLVPEKDYRLAFSYDACLTNPSRILPLGSLVIEEQRDRLVACTRDGSLRFDLLELFGGILSVLTADLFALLQPVRHRPRVNIDRLVAVRESWSFSTDELLWAKAPTEAGRFLAGRRWVREWDLPSRLFVKLKGERKPIFVDMESPVLVELLARAVRRLADGNGIQLGESRNVEVTEMLPGVEESWLSDRAGHHYTAELRLVALDLLPRP